MLKRAYLCLMAALTLCSCTRLENPDSSLDKSPELIEEDAAQVSMTCTKDGDVHEFEARGDQLTKSKQVFLIEWNTLFPDQPVEEGQEPAPAAITEEQRQQALEAVENTFVNIDGVNAFASEKDNGIEVVIEVDYEQANLEQLAVHGLIDEAEVQNRFVSFEKTRTELESSGYACMTEVE